MITSFVLNISAHIHADKCADLFASFTNTSNWNPHSVPLYKRQTLHLSCWTAGQFSIYIHYPTPQKSPTCFSAADTALLAFLLYSTVPWEGIVAAISWQKELCKTQESLFALANSYFQEAGKTTSRSVFKTQQWNSLELPVHISHSQKHTHM